MSSNNVIYDGVSTYVHSESGGTLCIAALLSPAGTRPVGIAHCISGSGLYMIFVVANIGSDGLLGT